MKKSWILFLLVAAAGLILFILDKRYAVFPWKALLLVALVVIAASVWLLFKKDKLLAMRLIDFFGTNARELPVVSRSFSVLEFPNLHIAIREYAKLHGTCEEVLGYYAGPGLPGLASSDPYYNSTTGPPQYKNVDTDVGQQMQCPTNAVYLIRTADGSLAVQVSYWEGATQVQLHVLATSSERAAAVIEEIRKLVSESSVYRGKIVSLEGQAGTEDEPGWFNVRFHKFPEIKKEEIILPPGTMELIERNVVSFYKHADVLRKAGRSVRRGILFYGNPGTGKTYTAKYLAQSLKNVTVFLLSGEQLWLIKEAFHLARMLAPALVIMEDVDLIAHSRDQRLEQTVLHQLLNELDGLSEQSDVIVLLTTNRPEVIEPALALRPGRVDQAIKFPLPDADCRRRLFDLYGAGLHLAVQNLDKFVDKTEGASPAFIQELLRKAALIAAESGDFAEGDKLSVTDAHLQKALDELLLGSPLTRSILGFRPAKS